MSVFGSMLETLFSSQVTLDAKFYSKPLYDNAGDIILDNLQIPILSNGASSIIDVKVIPSNEDEISLFGETRTQSEVRQYDVLRLSMGGIIPAKDDRLKVGGIWSVVKSKPRIIDPEGHLWRLECYPANDS